MSDCSSIEDLLDRLISKIDRLEANNCCDELRGRILQTEKAILGLKDASRIQRLKLQRLLEEFTKFRTRQPESLLPKIQQLQRELKFTDNKVNNVNDLVTRSNRRIKKVEDDLKKIENPTMSIKEVQRAAITAIREQKDYAVKEVSQKLDIVYRDNREKLNVIMVSASAAAAAALALVTKTSVAAIATSTAASTTAIVTAGGTAAGAIAAAGGAATAAIAASGGAATTAIVAAGGTATTAIVTSGGAATAAISGSTVAATAAIAAAAASVVTATLAVGTVTTVATNTIIGTGVATVTKASIELTLLRVAAYSALLQALATLTPRVVTVPVPTPFPVVQTNTVTQIERVTVPQVVVQTNTVTQIERVTVPQVVVQTNTVMQIERVTVPQVVVQTQVQTVPVTQVVTTTRPMTCAELAQCDPPEQATIKKFVRCDLNKEPIFRSEIISVPKGEKAKTEQIFERLANIEAEQCKEFDAVALIPEWWQIRAGQRPQLVVRYRKINDDGSISSSSWSLSIPHYNRDKNFKPKFPIYRKGNYQGMLVLKDNSKVIVYCYTTTEAKRLISAVRQYIDPKFLDGSYEKYGERRGVTLSTVSVKATAASFFEFGQKGFGANWTISLN